MLLMMMGKKEDLSGLLFSLLLFSSEFSRLSFIFGYQNRMQEKKHERDRMKKVVSEVLFSSPPSGFFSSLMMQKRM